jgi:hypothetical protein
MACGQGKHALTVAATRADAIAETAASIQALAGNRSMEAARTREILAAVIRMLQDGRLEPVGRCAVCGKISKRMARHG